MNKKAGFLAAALLVLSSVAALAEQKGDSLYDLGVGIGVPISGLDLARFGGGSEKPGETGLALSPQYLFQVSPAVGLGAELTYMNFPGASVSLPGGPASSSGDLLAVEGVGRWLFDPSQSFSPYLIAGLGVERYAVTVEQGGTTILDSSSGGLTLSPGAGVRVDLGSRAEGMAELRWRLGAISRSRYGTGLSNALGLFLRLGWRA